MRKKRKAKKTRMNIGINSNRDVLTTPVEMPSTEDLVEELFIRENYARHQIKDMTAHGGKSYLEIQQILATDTFMSDEDRAAFDEAYRNSITKEDCYKQTRLSKTVESFYSIVASIIGIKKEDLNLKRFL